MMIHEERKYHRSDIAKQQLRTAVMLFLNEKDLSSVITLAAAASNVLYQLVCNAKQEPFLHYAQRVHDAFVGWTPKRGKYKNYIDNIFGVNVHKLHLILLLKSLFMKVWMTLCEDALP